MHHIYHTEGFILGSRNFGEAGRYYHIFTRDLGLITASAQGVRKMESKLRFVLQDFTYAKIDLVRGKDFWRVTSASSAGVLDSLNKRPELLGIVANIFLLLRRLLAGEEANPSLFSELAADLSFLEESGYGEDLSGAEAIIVLRLLSHLGYIGGGKVSKPLIASPLDRALVFEARKHRPEILSEINRALRESQL